MHRTITGFHVGEDGDWVAELACLHAQHVRHDPPIREASWVLDDDGRGGRIGEPLDCPLCDRAELPDGLEVARTTDTWDAHTVPAGLLRDHRVAASTWGLLQVERGTVGFHAETAPPIDIVLAAGDDQPIPPDVLHHVIPSPDARFRVQFLRRP